MHGSKRAAYGLASLALPPVLAWRILRLRRGRIPGGRLLKAAPWTFLLLVSWCLGEAIGTLTGSYNPLPTKNMR
jgi:hypothetical protein